MKPPSSAAGRRDRGAPDPGNFGRGLCKHKIRLYPGWDSPAEDKKIEECFDVNAPDLPEPSGQDQT